MAQRESGYQRVARDAYMTPPWVTEVLVADLVVRGLLPRRGANGAPLPIWEPAAGSGQMSGALAAAGFEVYASDIEPEAKGFTHDFLRDDPPVILPPAGAIITNPPYNRAEDFVARAFEFMQPAGGLVAMLLNLDWDSALTRRRLFGDCRGFARKLVLLDRITWFERLPEPGKLEQSPSENHAWFIWDFARCAAAGGQAKRLQDAAPATLGWAAMPEHEKRALAARRRERRLAADERDRKLGLAVKPRRLAARPAA